MATAKKKKIGRIKITSKKSKNARIDLRISADQKEKIQKAVDARGVKVSDFILRQVMPEVEQILAEQKQVVLDDRAWQAFMEIMEDPRPASENLKSAMKNYLKSRGQ